MEGKHVSLGILSILRESDYIFLYQGETEHKDTVAKIEFFLDGRGIHFVKGKQKIYITSRKQFRTDGRGIYFMDGRDRVYVAGSTRPIEHPDAEYLEISVNVKKEYGERVASLEKRRSLLSRIPLFRQPAEGAERKGIFARLPSIPAKKIDTKPILEEICLQNLDEVGADNPRLALVQTAHILRDFFELRLDLKKELTYDELVDEISRSDIRKSVKDKAMGFFKTMELVYSGDFSRQSFEKMHEAAKDIIKSAD